MELKIWQEKEKFRAGPQPERAWEGLYVLGRVPGGD